MFALGGVPDDVIGRGRGKDVFFVYTFGIDMQI